MPSPTLTARYQGCLLGLAVGDAVGTSVEFCPPNTFPPVTDMVGGGVFQLQAGQWTDDTSMALCLAESLLSQQRFDPLDQLQRYLRWYQHGYLSSTGRCFDIGNTVLNALSQFQRTGEPYCGSTDPRSAGNGSLMRLAPIPLFYAPHPELALKYAADSSATTHAAAEAVSACQYFCGLIVGALNGVDKVTLLQDMYTPVANTWQHTPLAPAVLAIAQGSYRHKQAPSPKNSKQLTANVVRGSGYVVHTLEAVLWAFYHTDSFRDGLLKVVNLGEDADTTGAIYGQLAGAYYGVEQIPTTWLTRLCQRDMISEFAEGLYRAATDKQ